MEDEIHKRTQIMVEKMIQYAFRHGFDCSFYIQRFASPKLIKKYKIETESEMLQCCLDWYFLKDIIDDLGINLEHLSFNDTVPVEYIFKKCDNYNQLEWTSLSIRCDLTYILNHQDYPWDWDAISSNYNIKWKNVIKYDHLPWDWRYLQEIRPFSSDKEIFWQQIVEITKHSKLSFFHLSYNKTIPLWFIEENINECWDRIIIANPKITIDFMKRHPRPKFLDEEGWMNMILFLYKDKKELEANREFFESNSVNNWDDLCSKDDEYNWRKILRDDTGQDEIVVNAMNEFFGYERYKEEFYAVQEEVYIEHLRAKLIQNKWKNASVSICTTIGISKVFDDYSQT